MAKKLKNKGLREASENMGFGGYRIKWNKVTSHKASKALSESHGMSKSLYNKLRNIKIRNLIGIRKSKAKKLRM